MGLSRNTFVYNGGARVFDANFALGVMNPDYIEVFVEGEVDGLGEQVFRAFTYDPGNSTVTVTAPIPAGSSVVVQRTVPKDHLVVSFVDGSDVTKKNLDTTIRHALMAVQEIVDGRIDAVDGLTSLVVQARDYANAADEDRIDAEAAVAQAQAALAEMYEGSSTAFPSKAAFAAATLAGVDTASVIIAGRSAQYKRDATGNTVLADGSRWRLATAPLYGTPDEIKAETYDFDVGDYLQIGNVRYQVVAAGGQFTTEGGAQITHTGESPNADDFPGTDLERLQAAMDYCQTKTSQNQVSINLSRKFDITGGSIWVSPTVAYPYVNIYGGEIYKGDSGFVIDCTANNMSRSAPRFYNTTFSGPGSPVVPIVYNCTKMIGPQATNCKFLRFCLAKSMTYIQSIRMNSGMTYLQPAAFIQAQNLYDPNVTGVQGEAAGFPFVKLTGNGGGNLYTIAGGRFDHNLFEGYANAFVFEIGSCAGTSFSHNYTEANKGFIKFIPETGDVAVVAADIRGNFAYGYTADCFIDATDRGSADALMRMAISGNTCSNFAAAAGAGTKYLVKGAYTRNRGEKTNYLPGVKESSLTSISHDRAVLSAVASAHPTAGTRITLTGFNTGGNIAVRDLSAAPLLISLSGPITAANAPSQMRYSFLGILTTESYWSSLYNEVIQSLRLTPLVYGAIAGNINGQQGETGNISVAWADTGGVDRLWSTPSPGENLAIWINLPNAGFVAGQHTCSAVPLTKLIQEGGIQFPSVRDTV